MNNRLLFLVLLFTGLQSPAQTVRKVLVEEFTGAWCGGCPDAAVRIENLEAIHPLNTIALAWHEWDDLEIPEWPAVRDMFGVVSYPAGAVDRYKYPGNAHIHVSHLTFNSHYNDRMSVPAIASIALRDPYFDGQQYHFSVDMNFDSTPILGVPIKMNVYITEDSIPATGSLEQTNYLSTIQNGANPLVNWFHNKTVRRGLAGSWGMVGPLPPQVTPGVTYTQNLSFIPDSTWNISNLNLVAYLAYDGDTSLNQKAVINAETVRLAEWLNTTGIHEEQSKSLQLYVYPNPASISAKIRLEINTPEKGKLKIEVLNSFGTCVSKPYVSEEIPGLHTFEWSASEAIQALSPGLYEVRVSCESGTAESIRIVLAR